ncbi:Lysophospholipase L1 [Mariniphaga anaerophila]|uniref:Lysophospholipase L1 n=1 Tax=Mariniphaga anaerophila TaxID=1484053 RepID=A0A1M5DQC5_9BACT|nr:SGNH/GDSL hydrolase family protein [Mariniphaga anaerophila]SHF69084.1 Lysophospholipase L1 [Mariniphaga anaerophila]
MRLFLVLFALVLPVFGFSVSPDSLKYVDAADFPVIGKGFTDTQTRYERLPSALESTTRPPVWNLSKNCSGMAIRFRTNSTVIAAKWEVTGDVFMNHFTMTGIKGLDLYCLKDGKWQFVNSGRPKAKSTTAVIIQNMTGDEMEYMLYLPLYDGLKSLEIGVEQNALLDGPAINSPKTGHPIVFYGTSITQGGCASRAGMSYTNILGRMLDREIVNLGFSGNGQLDLEVAEAIATIPSSCIVMDCVPNVSVAQMNEKYHKFIELIREGQPETPIIFVETILFPHRHFDQHVFKLLNEKNATLKRIFDERKKGGDKNIYYVKSDKLIGNDQEATVDGVHLTDLGFKRMAENLYPVLRKRMIKN